MYYIHSDEARRVQESLQHFGFLEGNTTICSLYDIPSAPIHESDGESIGSQLNLLDNNEPEPISVDDIYSEEGEEDEIFTYVYNYNSE